MPVRGQTWDTTCTLARVVTVVVLLLLLDVVPAVALRPGEEVTAKATPTERPNSTTTAAIEVSTRPFALA